MDSGAASGRRRTNRTATALTDTYGKDTAQIRAGGAPPDYRSLNGRHALRRAGAAAWDGNIDRYTIRACTPPPPPDHTHDRIHAYYYYYYY